MDVQEKDLVTECTADEFRAHMRENGMPIEFISDRTLDADDVQFRHEIRRAFLLDLEARMIAAHSWDRLYVNRDNDLIYAGIDRCRKCRRIRNTVALPIWYFRLRRDPDASDKEPPCVEVT